MAEWHEMISRSAFKVVAIIAVISLSSCVSRPTSEVLKPVKLDGAAGQEITVLAATNRTPNATEPGFGGAWAGKLSYERYQISAPPQRKGTAITYVNGTPKPDRQYIVKDRHQLTKQDFLSDALRSIGPDGTMGVFIHGYNYSYQEALFRIAQIGADARLPGAPILFSWPSAAVVAGYVADRDAALASRGDLHELVQALSESSKVRRIVLFAHSMGAFLTMETVRELKLQGRDDVLRKLTVVLAAPDIDVDVFRAQLRDIGRMQTPITLLVSKVDRALSVSSLIGGERQRVGRMDVDDPIVQEAAVKEGVRVIDITSVAGSDGLGHDRYASLAGFGAQEIAREGHGGASLAGVGAFVFNTAGDIAASPFRLAGKAF
ncbi:alpha/beta hydrolase [Aliirhizobium cellulosilyticum]|uniref:Esterase/lipase superfamily enzyme n=1 Tax=Aliirhizobium cellulosilyticum TaxID=393664 RepID=A0A7W6SEP9_9HYPH|nr:alpha/beta fold hydrolase [Rhizobium cellulosilyticum]MBB4351732.1 esterase/lipase superfamily enzyme [Rhizobium cellulosilyticum]MBB4415012.1 esterase/lipase superfamily enzyme [Rhizobium cellulosilyticum]MBB4449658.1 esterase/lipase superfamily enzyme [Rhizobium cellulosilyticum]